MGAGAIITGFRVIASIESEFHPIYKNVVPEAETQDILLVTGALGPIRLWKNEFSLHRGHVADKEEKMAEKAKFPAEDIIAEGKAYEAAYTGDINSGAVLLGQSIGIIESNKNVKVIIELIVSDAEKRFKNDSHLIK